MSESLTSGSWYRVAGLRPGLAPGLRIVRQVVRGQVWHLLVEPASGRQLRLNPPAYDLVGRFDGRATMAELWARVLQLRQEAAPTQDEALGLLAQLFRAGMVQFDAAPHLSLLFARRAQEGDQQRRGWINPLFLRTRLADPTAWLLRLAPVGAVLFSARALVLWLVAVAWALLAAGAEWPVLQAHAARLLQSPSSLALAWLCYPVIKALHELGHGLAVRRFGGEVREVGLSLMMLTPAPYVDASAATAFPSARQRFVVSAAGILVELGLAAVALAVWLTVADGWLRDLALTVVLIGTVSTLFFNGNPLVRLDGYHMLCDALGLPNLAARSQAWWARQWARLTKSAGASAAPLLAPGERFWLVLHAPLAWAYRLALLAALVMWVGQQSWLAGWLAGAFLLAWLVRGCWRWLATTGTRGRQAGALVGGSLLVLLCVVPAPSSVLTTGVVWPEADAQLRAEVGGFVDAVLVPDGATVQAGQTVLVLADPVLTAQRDKVAAQRASLQAQAHAAWLKAPAEALRLQAELTRQQAEFDRAEEQLAQLAVRAQVAGRVAWNRPQDLPGSHARRGALLGRMVTGEAARVRMALPEQDFSRVRGQVRGVEVRLASQPGQVWQGSLQPQMPGASFELPAAALGDRQGGPIAMDPADREGLRTRFPVLLLEVAVPQLHLPQVGERAWVKVVLAPEPVAAQVWRRLSQVLIRQFRPAGQL